MSSGTPSISVVIGVYNGASEIRETLGSVLEQEGVDLECVVVDDGSSDDTWLELKHWAARESRLRPHRMPRGGLTKALIAGCAMARGAFIARQDVGDVSLPGRLKKQQDLLAAQPQLAFVACQCVTLGPGGEVLGEPNPQDGGDSITQSLKCAPKSGMKAPHHGSVMFRRSAYEAVGGYRPEFYFAQDLDLWSRLIEVGDLAFVTEPLYQSSFAPGDISARFRDRQLLLRNLIGEATLRRRSGRSETDVLDKARRIRPQDDADPRRSDAAANYFIGSCLHKRGDPEAARFFRNTLAANPVHMKAWVKLMSSRLRGPKRA